MWVNDDMAINDYVGLDRTGKNHDLYWLRHRSFFAARFPGKGVDEAVCLTESSDPSSPNVARMNTRTGALIQEVKNPGKVISWMVDGAGAVRAGEQLDKADKTGRMTRIIFRKDDKSPWLIPVGLDFAKDKIRPHWLSADGKLLYYSQVTPEGMWGVYTYDFDQQHTKELLLSHTKYDIIPDGAPILAPRTREILGFYYTTDKLRVIWIDPQMAAVQEALNKILPNRINAITSLSDDLQRMIVCSWSAREPGTYYRFDLGKRELKTLFPVLPWIKSAQMAESYPITYKARDGLEIHGYLTLPAGREPKNLPLVVYPHNGPGERDDWRFNLDVQFLANRGYAVLQPNYRGSLGYGPAFHEKCFHQLHRAVQDDITDGARWVIAQGIADPGRIAIMGYNFGGYCAMMGAEQNPQLYRCAISMSGILNWALEKYTLANYERFKEEAGDPETEIPALKEMSPGRHIDQLQAPLLLIYDSNEDHYFNMREDFRAFTKALDKAHKTYETFDKRGETVTIFSRKGRTDMLNRIDAFLAANMAPVGGATTPVTR